MMSTRKDQIEIAAMIAEIVASVAVVISVIYLAVQIADGTKELRSQSHHNALSLGQRPVEIELENADLARIISVGYADDGQLTEEEWYRFTLYQIMAFNAWEYYYYENMNEAIPEQLWVGANAYYENNILTKPGLKRYWTEYKHIYAQPFHTYVEEIFERADKDNN